MFYLVGIFRTSSPRDSISNNPDRTVPTRGGGGGGGQFGGWGKWGHIEVLPKRVDSMNLKRLLLIKENKISQIKKFRAFLCMGRCKNLGALKPFLSYTSQLCGAGIMHFFTLSSPPSHPPWHTHIWSAVTSLFIDMAGNTPFFSVVSMK